jgi:4-oxalmesaconate hydratase
MNIDVHGHYTTAPRQLGEWRSRQIAVFENLGERLSPDELEISDAEIAESLEKGQIPLQLERETDITLFSPTAGGMAHHYGDEETSKVWTTVVNDLVQRCVELFPQRFVGVAQLPQSPGVDPARCIPELERCIEELGFVGVNLNPDPTDGYWTGPAITDRSFYPLYERLVDYDVPAMIHVSMTCNPVFAPATAAHYLNGDITAFVQMATSDLFKDFPSLRFVIPHGGGAVPYQWGRFRGIVMGQGRGELAEAVLNNVFFDTCVYWQTGLKCLIDSMPEENVLYASEMIGAVRGRNPDTGKWFDDTKYLLDQLDDVSDSHRAKILGENALRVYPRLRRVLEARGLV